MNNSKDNAHLLPGADAYLLSQSLTASGPLLLMAPTSHDGLRLEQELKFFTATLDPNLPIAYFPDWELLPYDHFSPHQEIISNRLRLLSQLPFWQRGILIVTVGTLLQRFPTTEFIAGNTLAVKLGDHFDPQEYRQQLQQQGYRSVMQVMSHGEFASRGEIFDIFPMGCDYPLRIDLFDNDIESINYFDPDSQRSFSSVEKVDFLPAREFPTNEQGIAQFRQSWRTLFPGNPSHCPTYQTMSEGRCPSGIEAYLPLFFKETHSLLDFLPPASKIFRLPGVVDAAEQFFQEVKSRYQQTNIDHTRPLLPPNAVYFTAEELFNKAKQFSKLPPLNTQGISEIPNVTVNHKLKNPLHACCDFLQENQNGQVLLSAESAGRREILLELFHKQGLFPEILEDWQQFATGKYPLAIIHSPLLKGFCCDNKIIITETELFGEPILKQRRTRTKTTDIDNLIKSLGELAIGDPVVHLEHGVGRYQGLESIINGDHEQEFLTLEYANHSKLYVPIENLDLISRYSGGEHAPLHLLGSKQWQKAKEAVARQVNDVAAELLTLCAKRAAKPGSAYHIDKPQYDLFCDGFGFEETPDQAQAIAKVLEDLQQETPMDRLICGDVGFGKTEVAMRAAFVVMQAGKQVAMLVPTTLLAEQHLQNFLDRFADWPMEIEAISRFKTAKQQQLILEKLAAGKIDMIIGTHKLLQASINFSELGLLIIDEEHRFGVKQKEQLKKIRAEVDLLTLTATPIPRTLNMAMSGVRDLSIIATPPEKRLSIKTFVIEQNKGLIREAILREINRGGQVYFLNNQVETIARVARELEELVPEAKIRIAHGQLRERELEQVMADFYHCRFNVLVCTAIIETGIDIPSANTILINRADRFGLAQLHQLRGRVGRSHHQAYAYLLVADKKALTKDSEKRLEAISQLEELGVGFSLAAHDLEIRGAGELLGEEQSGTIHDIGLNLYTEMLNKTIAMLKKGEQPELDLSPQQSGELNLHVTALIPDPYLGDIHCRLNFYKRIACSTDKIQLDELQSEMIDRFGPLPEPAKNLFRLTLLRQQAKRIGIRSVDADHRGGKIQFTANTKVDPLAIIKLIQAPTGNYRLLDGETMSFKWNAPSAAQRFDEMERLLQNLSQGAKHDS